MEPGIKGSIIKGSKKGSSKLVFLPEVLQSLQPGQGEPGQTASQEMSNMIFSEGTIFRKKDPLLMAWQNNK